MGIEDLWALYRQEIESRDNKDYVVDLGQMRKLSEAVTFLREITDEDDDIEINIGEPREEVGGVTAEVILLMIGPEKIADLSRIIGYMSCISIDTTIDGRACISFNIPGVFKKAVPSGE